jgi:hypothetical protein
MTSIIENSSPSTMRREARNEVMFFISLMPSEICWPKFKVSWLCDDNIVADTFLVKWISRTRYKTNQVKSSQVKLLITNNAFCIVQRATAQSKIGIFRDCAVAEAPPGFQAGRSDCMHFFSLVLFILFAHLEIMQPRHWSPWDDQTTSILREIKLTYGFLCLGTIPSQLCRHHYALSSICRPQVYGRRRRRTKWSISAL